MATLAFFPPHQVLACFADISAVPVAALRSPSKSRAISRHRQRAMWILRQMSGITMKEIGELLGARSAATIKEGVDRIDAMVAIDRRERQQLDAIAAFMTTLLSSAAKASHKPGEHQVTAAVGILADQALSDADARLAALSILRTLPEVANHG